MAGFLDRARNSRYLVRLLLVLTAHCAAAGCSVNGRLPVSGSVFRDGAPLPGAYIGFENTAAQQPAGWGMTDASGQFQAWGSGRSAGLVPGTYRVWVDIRAPEPDPNAPTGGQSPLDREWAKRYSREESSLTVVIDEARDDLRIDLD